VMGAVYQPVQHGVGHRRTAEQFVPVVHGQLRGDDGGTVVVPVVQNFQQVALLRRSLACSSGVSVARISAANASPDLTTTGFGSSFAPAIASFLSSSLPSSPLSSGITPSSMTSLSSESTSHSAKYFRNLGRCSISIMPRPSRWLVRKLRSYLSASVATLSASTHP